MERSSAAPILADLERKLVILTGPRQSGKTTLARSLHTEHAYFNYDDPAHRLALRARDWDRSLPLVVFDELHTTALSEALELIQTASDSLPPPEG